MPVINLKDKIIPKGTKVQIDFDPGTPESEFSITVEPDDGYKFSLSNITITVPDQIEANIILKTENSEVPLFAENITNTTETISKDDFYDLPYVDSMTLYVKVLSSLSELKSVVVEFSGKQTIPYL